MAYTVELLSLIAEFPNAFSEPTEAPLGSNRSRSMQINGQENELLLSLMTEFPEAFSLPEVPSPHPVLRGHESSDGDPIPSSQDIAEDQVTVSIQKLNVPKGYELSLHQTISTFGWGTVELYLRYGSEKLDSIWVTVGKSGTEVQSFCEAIARLTNRLLAGGTPVPEIVRELRGIRGGDSEGLGPHRFLGLVDLIGKGLQEAPVHLGSLAPNHASAELEPHALGQGTVQKTAVSSSSVSEDSQRELNAILSSMTITDQSSSVDLTTEVLTQDVSSTHQWIKLSDVSAIASLCPDCGSELQQVNGCSGGACVVCGFSSCS